MVKVLLDAIEVPGDYYFVGNGMAPLRTAVSSLLSSTKLASHIHALPFSRDILQMKPRPASQLRRYFSSLGWRPGKPGKIVLIDSICSPGGSVPSLHGKGDVNSLLRLADEVVAHLVDQGMSHEAANHKVVVIGLPEYSRAYDLRTFNIVSNQREYSRALDKFLRGESKTRPFINPLLTSKQRRAYGGTGLLGYDNPNWNVDGPYKKFDTFRNGKPARSKPFLQGLFASQKKGPEPFQIKAMLVQRLQFIAWRLKLERRMTAFLQTPEGMKQVAETVSRLTDSSGKSAGTRRHKRMRPRRTGVDHR